jgi:ribosomal protein S18 acetylase RimI-like enzyme
MTVRRATLQDSAEVARLNAHVQGWHAAHYPEVFHARPDPAAVRAYFQAWIADPVSTIFLSGDPAVGYAACTLQFREPSIFSPGIRRLMIDHIAVAPKARRQGHGRALIQAARQLARDQLAEEVLLDTWEANHDAHAFFRAEGFAVRRMLFRATP